MDDPGMLVVAWAAGGALGAIFFGGLWWTVRRGLASGHPARWFLGSLLVRSAIALAGIFVVSGRQWERLLLCLLGFVMARAVTSWQIRRPRPEAARAPAEVHHAPQPR